MRKRIIGYVILFALFFFLALLFTFPSVLHLTDKFIGDGVDNYQHAGFQHVAYESMRAGHWPFSHTALWRFPVGFDFSRGFDGVLSTLTGALLFGLFQNIVLSYNLTVLFLLALNGFLSYFLFRYISKSRFVGFIGGMIYGLSFYSLLRGFGHPNLIVTGGFPFLLFCLLQYYHQSTKRNLFFVAVALVVVFMSSLQYTALLSIAVIVGGLVFFAAHREVVMELVKKLLSHRQALVWFVVAIVTVFCILFTSQVVALIKGDFLFAQKWVYNPWIRDYFIPNKLFPMWYVNLLSGAAKHVEEGVFIGFVELILFVWFLIKTRGMRLKRPLVLLIGIFFLFSLGVRNPETGLPMPYVLLISVLPFKAIVETGRYYILFYVGITLGISVVLGRLYHRSVIGKMVVATVFCLLILERLTFTYALSDTFKGDFLSVAQSLPSRAVLDIPIASPRYDVLPSYYKKPIIGGYIHWSGDTSDAQLFLNQNQLVWFTCYSNAPAIIDTKAWFSQLLGNLSRNGVDTIVVHKDDRWNWPECVDVVRRYKELFPHVTEIDPAPPESLLEYHWDMGALTERWYFPQDGYLDLWSLHYTYVNGSPLITISLNGNPMALDKWIVTDEIIPSGKNIWHAPPHDSYPYRLALRAGDFLDFSSMYSVMQPSFFTVTYAFTPTSDIKKKIPVMNGLQLEYQDSEREVWSITQ
ncbi:MAG: hypothetical protein WC775_04840 [Patescibacteria group bacterium]|jgi:hypothetical protein